MARKDYIPAESAKTLDGLFRERALRSPEKVSHVAFEGGRWRSRTWAGMYREAGRWQAGFAREGLAPGERVALMLRNSPEWVLFDQAALSAGLVVVPLYTVDRPDNVAYVLGHSGAKLVLFDTQEQWEQFRALKLDLPGVDRVLVLNPSGAAFGDPRVKSAREWLPESGSMRHVSDDGARLASIIYTSGTTGRPKGVMLSHWNMLANCRDGLACGELYADDEFLSFLPLSHTFERTVGYYLPMMTGSTVAFARSTQELAQDLLDIRPTMLVSVPRIYDRAYARVQQGLAKKGMVARALFAWAEGLGWRRFEAAQGRGAAPGRLANLPWPLLAVLFFAAERFVVDLEVREQTHSFSLSEIALLLALMFAAPVDLLIGQALGAGLALSLRPGQRPIKLLFNLANFALAGSVALVVFRLIVGSADPLGLAGWLGAFAATFISDLVGAACVATVIWLSQRERPNVGSLFGVGTIYTLIAPSVALLAATVLWYAPAASWLLVVLGLMVYVMLRWNGREIRRHRSVSQLHESTRRIQAAFTLDDVARSLLATAREMFEAELAELLLFSADGTQARQARLSGDAALDGQAQLGWRDERLDPLEAPRAPEGPEEV